MICYFFLLSPDDFGHPEDKGDKKQASEPGSTRCFRISSDQKRSLQKIIWILRAER